MIKLDRILFWDVDFEKLDYDKYASFVIERVFEKGDVEDILMQKILWR